MIDNKSEIKSGLKSFKNKNFVVTKESFPTGRRPQPR